MNNTNKRLAVGLLAAIVMALRLPLWLLPGPGRDEAAYHYWAHHPEPAYAPLLQLAVRFFEMLGGHSLWTLRAPVIVLGFVVVVLNDRRLDRANAPSTLRLLAAFALALCPWQSFSASILHPDNFMLAALLGLILAVQASRLWWTVLATVLAVLAKPTGVLFLPVTWWLIGYFEGVGWRQRGAARTVLGLTGIGFVAAMDPTMVSGMADFGRLAMTIPWYERGLVASISLVFLGGLLLVGLAWWGARQRWQILRDGEASYADQAEARASLAFAGMLIFVFVVAAAARGQFKANWVLPAFVLLWPVRSFGRPGWMGRRLAVTGLALALLSSVGQTFILTNPVTFGRLESLILANDKTPDWAAYSNQAGAREAVVSASRSWSDHTGQYQNLLVFAGELADGWQQATGLTGTPEWLITDDYGLACQLSWYWAEPSLRIAVLDDAVFHSSLVTLERAAPYDPVLSLASSDARLLVAEQLPQLAHPVAGRKLNPTVAHWRADPKMELVDMSFSQRILSHLPLVLAAFTTANLATTSLAATDTSARGSAQYASYDSLLTLYVQDSLVDYDKWYANSADTATLHDYVAQLAAQDPAEWAADEALAYWINLYNAVTLNLILDNYPLESIKDIGGFLKTSPWKRELVTVAGQTLTLNDIENKIIRPQFKDPRIHFALNCASIGCPPLSAEVYLAERLSAQLDAACVVALNRDQWVRVEGDKLVLTKIFDWYGDDFKADGDSVLDFIKRYRTEPMPSGKPKISYGDYNWSLNKK